MAHEALEKLIGRLVRRVRVVRALDAAVRTGLFVSALLGAVLAWHKFQPIDPRVWPILVAAACAAVLAGAAAGFARPVSRLAAAKSADVRLALDDRLSSAVEFMDESGPTPFMLAHLDDADARAGEVRAADAIPVRRPRGLRPLSAAIIVLGFLLIVPGFGNGEGNRDGPRIGTVPISPMRFAGERTVDSLLARVDPYREAQLNGLLRELKALYASARKGAITREEALERIAELDAKLRQAESDRSGGRTARTWRQSVEKALAEKGRELLKDPATADLGRAMMEGNLDEASKESRSLAGAAAADPPTMKLNAEQSKALAELLKNAAQAEARELDVLSKDLEAAAKAMNEVDMRQFAEGLEDAAEEFARLKEEMEKMKGLARTDEELEEMQQALGALERDETGRWTMKAGRGGRGPGGFFQTTGVEPPEKGLGQPGIGSTPDGPGTGGTPERIDVTKTPVDISGKWGSGASLIEIVRGAASEGVAGEAYREAAEAASRAAESAVHGEDIPLGYRLYVKRYFQMIQPPPKSGDR